MLMTVMGAFVAEPYDSPGLARVIAGCLLRVVQGCSQLSLERIGSSENSCFRLYFDVLSNWYATNPHGCWGAVYDFNCAE